MYGETPIQQRINNGPVRYLDRDADDIRVACDREDPIAQLRLASAEWLPKYAPELNDIENNWRDLKRHFLASHLS